MITHLYRYPVKGLNGEALTQLRLISQEGIEGDRAIALARTPGIFDPAAPKAASKLHFLMLAKDEALARLQASFDAETQTLTLQNGPTTELRETVKTPAGRTAIEAFFKAYLGKADLAPHLVFAPGHKFTDISVVSPQKMRAISLINLNSIRALETAIGQPVDHRRFRANVYFEDIPAWDELNWEGREIKIGKAIVRGVLRTKRCPATQVNPDTAERDINIPAEIRKHFGHFDMGLYAEVQTSSEITIGDHVSL